VGREHGYPTKGAVGSYDVLGGQPTLRRRPRSSRLVARSSSHSTWGSLYIAVWRVGSSTWSRTLGGHDPPPSGEPTSPDRPNRLRTKGNRALDRPKGRLPLPTTCRTPKVRGEGPGVAARSPPAARPPAVRHAACLVFSCGRPSSLCPQAASGPEVGTRGSLPPHLRSSDKDPEKQTFQAPHRPRSRDLLPPKRPTPPADRRRLASSPTKRPPQATVFTAPPPSDGEEEEDETGGKGSGPKEGRERGAPPLFPSAPTPLLFPFRPQLPPSPGFAPDVSWLRSLSRTYWTLLATVRRTSSWNPPLPATTVAGIGRPRARDERQA